MARDAVVIRGAREHNLRGLVDDVTDATAYHILVHGWKGASGQVCLSIDVPPGPHSLSFFDASTPGAVNYAFAAAMAVGGNLTAIAASIA